MDKYFRCLTCALVAGHFRAPRRSFSNAPV
jgi:hypothetical protein